MPERPPYLRKIKLLKWLSEPPWVDPPAKYNAPPWLAGGQVAADAVHDLLSPCGDGRISLYVARPEAPELIRRIGAAINARGSGVEKFEYCLIPPKLLDDLSLKVEPNEGNTPDDEVNRLHVDIVELTGSDAVRLATALKPLEANRYLVDKSKIKDTLRKGIDDGVLDRRRVSTKILEELGLVA